jgi:hypothetical protein
VPLNLVNESLWNIGVGYFPRARRRRQLIIKPFTPIQREKVPSLKKMHNRPAWPELLRIEHAINQNGAREMMHRFDVNPAAVTSGVNFT